MLDPVKTAFAGLGTAFAAGVAWMTLKARVDQTRRDVNRMGSERVKKVEEELIAVIARLDAEREDRYRRQEHQLRREMHFRERLARLEQQAGIPAVAESFGEPS